MINKDILKLKELVLDRSQTDKSGYSELNKLAIRNSQLPKESPEKRKEETLVIDLLDHASDFKEPDISRLISYIKESNFSEENIFDGYLKFITSKNEKLNLLQLTELTRFIVQLNPENVPEAIITVGLSPLKDYDPWLYGEILSNKSPYKGLQYIRYLITSGKTDNNRLTHWLSNQFKSNDILFLKKIPELILPLITNQKVKSICSYLLEKKGIVSGSQRAFSKNSNASFESYHIVSSEPFKKFKGQLKKHNQSSYAY